MPLNPLSQMSNLSIVVLITTYFLCGQPSVVVAQDLAVEWGNTHSSAGENFARSTFTDNSGNVYAVGYFSGTVDFDPSNNVVSKSSQGGRDAFITKYSPSGSLIWVKTVGGVDQDMGEDVFVDRRNNIYFTGSFRNVISEFDGDFVNLNGNGQDDVFVIKLDAEGDLVWAKGFGGSGVDEPEAVRVDAAGNVYNVGRFFYSLDFDPGAAVHTIVSNGGWDYYVQKLDSMGKFVWAHGLGSVSNDYILDLEFDPNGDIVMVGNFQRTMDFDPSSSQDIRSSSGARDIWVSKWDSDANMKWTKTYGSVSDDWSRTVEIDEEGSIYSAGSFGNHVWINESTDTHSVLVYGSFDGYIQKMKPNGETLWLKNVGGFGYDRIWGLAVDGAHNVYVSGEFSSDGLGFNGGAVVPNLNRGSSDVFLLKLDEVGQMRYLGTGGSTGKDWARGLHVDQNANVYMTGSFENEAIFEFGTDTFTLTAIGQNDGYLLKLSQCIINKYQHVERTCSNYTWINGVTYTQSREVVYYETVPGCDTIHHLILDIGAGANLYSGYFYPNPSEGIFQLRENEELIEIQIYNMIGQLIYESIGSEALSIKLDVADGSYIARFKTSCGSFKQKLIIVQ